MKKFLFMALGLALLTSCTQPKQVVLLDESAFEATVDGKQTALYTLTAGDITMQVTNFGARVVTLWTPDKQGNMEDIVLGYNNIDTYVNNPGERFLGACVGRYANRIAAGKFTLDGKEYQLSTYNNGQCLHGGDKGFDMVVWDVVSATENEIVFHYLSPDGEENFPGNLDVTMTYTLTPENEFKVTYLATTDAPTYCNISHHSFFNLKGEGNGTINDHVMTINGSYNTPIDNVYIPTGEIASVEGTPFDFRAGKVIGEGLVAEKENEQLVNGAGYDHNWILDRKSENDIEFAASVWEPVSGRYMEVWTDQPALQFYGGNFFDGSTEGKWGRTLNYRESYALETQLYPDSPNHSHFPSTRLNPGEEYTHTCIYKFATK